MADMHDPTDYADQQSTSFFDFLNWFQPLTDLLLRLTVAWAFYQSGITKVVAETIATLPFIGDFKIPTSLAPTDSTIMLFEYEYSVPILPPDLAAQLGTAAEIILPVLLAFGLFGRLSALGLFVFNVVAVLSYEAAQTTK